MDSTSVPAGQNAVLTATSSATVTGTVTAIEIFDLTAGVLVGACSESSQCIVAYAARSGVRTFAAFVTPATTVVPVNGPTIESNQLDVSWVGVGVKVTNAIVGPGKAITVTATSTVPVEHSGDVLELFDGGTNLRLTYCSRGTTCSTSVTQAAGGTRTVVAAVAKSSVTFPAPETQSQSEPATMTWLNASLAANTTYPQAGGTVYLTASANADLSSTPWSLGIYDEQGHLVDKAC
ncbi:MAG TPA: hypothetical protein VET26_01035, partial [Candidatus Sulfotelmatobacter sp.]|nr:hypothetical protein [Candidatus Sulfotelmatobacter sp.]